MDVIVLKQEYERFEAAMQELGGCTDGYCIIVRPKGMHTNGGCRCSSNRNKMERLGRYAMDLRRAISAAIRAASSPTLPKMTGGGR
jgi:hypothetical protein